jgi:hypothetical protein
MEKKIKSQKKPKSELGAKNSNQPIVRKKPVNHVLVVFGSSNNKAFKKKFKDTLKQFTGAEAVSPVGCTTPEGKKLCIDENNECGTTPGGSKLIYSPSMELFASVTTPSEKHKEKYGFLILQRKKDYQSKKISSTHAAILKSKKQTKRQPSISVTANKKTRESQPKRATQRAEQSAVGKTAKQLVKEYCKNEKISISEKEIESENWNLCHLVSYGVAKNATQKDKTIFDPQVRKNLYSGSHALNANMMRIENPLLEMIQADETKEIEYEAEHAEYESSHILSDLTLKARIETNHGVSIAFSKKFDVTDTRKQSSDTATANYVFLKSVTEHHSSLFSSKNKNASDHESVTAQKKISFL